MSTSRIDRERSGWVNQVNRPTGPTGRPLCRYCGGEIQDRKRRTFCSEDCVTEHRIRTDPGFVRTKVFARDHGVCVRCGFDTEQIPRMIAARAQDARDPIGAKLAARRAVLTELGIPLHRQTYWDADHIVPVVKGGGACGLDNYRTLCVPCHQAETARLAAERARANRMERDRRDGFARLRLDGVDE